MKFKSFSVASAAVASLCAFFFLPALRAQYGAPGHHFPEISFSEVPYGWVDVYGNNTMDSGGLIENGTILFAPVNNLGQPISFRSAGGTGATAAASFGITIASQSPGSGYSGSWSCAVNGGTYSSAASCTATVSSGGLVFAITSAGSYTAAPTGLTFSGGTYAAGAPASASLSMTISSVSVLFEGAGYGYTTVSFPGCTGTVTGSVTVTSGAVTAITASGGSCPGGTPVSILSEGQQGPDPFSATVTDGVFSILVPDTQLSYPLNVCYSVTIIDNVTGEHRSGPGYGCVQPAGSGPCVTGSQAWCTAPGSLQGGTANFDIYPLNLAALLLVQSADFAGSCTMAGATTCTFSIPNSYAVRPIMFASPQGATYTGGMAYCSLSGATVTVTAPTSNSLTWACDLVGNPN